jgi:DNA-binding transcriptional regulator YdaS (Cro superfamily)
MKLIEYLNERGAQSALAREISVSPVQICQWAWGRRPVPAERCLDIEKATRGAVTCEDLRPDVDWGYLRATPAPIEKILTTTRAQFGIEAQDGA